ncbi:MAG: chemotaxis protein, partial [Pseudomonadota bacterium]
SSGIGQVNTAVTQLDQMTQQNAALVEESAAAAESLKDQAHKLNGLVATFRLDDRGRPAGFGAAPVPPVATAKPAAPATPHQSAARALIERVRQPAPPAKPAAAPAAAAPVPVAAVPAAAPAAAPAKQDDGEWETF